MEYIAVHAYGVPEILPAVSQKIDVLEKTFKEFEAGFKDQWDRLPDDYKNELLDNITAFTIKITKIEGKFKLSQNKTESERKSIINSLTQSTDKIKVDIAKKMIKNH